MVTKMSMRILIADDNDAARSCLAEELGKREGWEVCAVNDGRQAVAKAAELKPKLIILDLAMPVMDGLQATREIGQILPSVPILIYTFHQAPWLELEAKKAGARQVISKPDAETLLSVVEGILAKEPQHAVEGTALAATAAAETKLPAAHNNSGLPATARNESDSATK
jgi:CheY-like chemotaxis protein